MKLRWLALCGVVAVAGLGACGSKEETKTPAESAKVAEAAPSQPKAEAKPAPSQHQHHGEAGHAHGSPHGGIVVSAGEYHLEAVPTKVGLLVFLLDENEKELPLTGVSGKMTFLAEGKEPQDVALEVMGNHLHGHVSLDGKWSAAVTVSKDGKPLVARFEGEGASVASQHNHHEHLALSEEVTLQLTPRGDIKVGEPVTFDFLYLDKDKQPISDFEVVHEEKLHLFFISEDLEIYDHVHPVLSEDPQQAGRFTLTHTFTKAGAFQVYSDFKSTRLGATLVKTPLTVPGDAAPSEAKPLVVDSIKEKSEGVLKVAFESRPTEVIANQDVFFVYTLSDENGQPATDIEPYLGAMGHLFILHEDLVTMAHSHPKGAEPTPEMRGGPVVEFHTILPKPGKYKAWVQFQRKGKVYTLPWVIEAK